MASSDSNSPLNDPSYSRERLELETRVLAAALRQSLEIGDTAGSSLAHEQIFLLLKASQEMVVDEPVSLPREISIDRGRQLPDIDWGVSDDSSSSAAAANPEPAAASGQISGPEPSTETSFESSSENRPEASTETSSESWPEASTETSSESRPGTSPENSPEIYSEINPEIYSESSPASIVEFAPAPGVEANADSSTDPNDGQNPNLSSSGVAESFVGDSSSPDAVAEFAPFDNRQAALSSEGAEGEARNPQSFEPFQALQTVQSGQSGQSDQSDQSSDYHAKNTSAEQMHVREDGSIADPFVPSEAESAASDPSAVQAGDAVAEVVAATEAIAAAPVIIDENDYYQYLRVTEVADFASIHLAFWRRLRPLLRQEIGLIGPQRLTHLKKIQKLWIAHDILCDPVTRADYDFRRMGLRGGDQDDEEARLLTRKTLGPRTQLRIGELLQCAGLLEQTELDIAADMHKAMPEMMFGTFLVKQGFIEEDDLNCVLVGQQLLKTGDITVVQFQTVMLERSASGLDIGEMLLAKGYVSAAMLERAYRNQSEDTLVKVPVISAAGQVTKIDFSSHNKAPEVAASAAPPPETSAPVLQSIVTEPQDTADSEPTVTGEPDVIDEALAPNLLNEGLLTTPVLPTPVAPSPPMIITERTFNLGNAAPSWKDQLDWSSPDPEPVVAAVEPAIEFVPEPVAEFVPEVQAVDHSAALQTAAPDMVQGPLGFVSNSVSEPESGSESGSVYQSVAEPGPQAQPQTLAQSEPEPPVEPVELVDTVVKIAQIWAEETPREDDWVQERARKNTIANPFASREQSPSVSSFLSPRPVEHLPAEALPVDVSAFDSAADSAASFSSEKGRNLSQVSGDTADDTFSEIETSGNLPSLGQLELLDKSHEEQEQTEDLQQSARMAEVDKELQEHSIPKRGTGDWQIMSMPGSALTSLFLDEEPEAPARSSTGARDNAADRAGESQEDQLQTGPRAVHVLDMSSGADDQAPASADAGQIDSAGQVHSDAAQSLCDQSDNPDKVQSGAAQSNNNQPNNGGSKKPRRRRSRQ